MAIKKEELLQNATMWTNLKLTLLNQERRHTHRTVPFPQKAEERLPWGGDGLGRGPGNLAGVMEMFCVMRAVWLTLAYPLVTADQTACSRWV